MIAHRPRSPLWQTLPAPSQAKAIDKG